MRREGRGSGSFKLKRRRVGAREGYWGKGRADVETKVGMR